MATAIMTDNNPKFNVSRPAKYFTLAQVLEDMGFKFKTIDGQYDGQEEKSLIVYGIDFETATGLGQEYGQESILFLPSDSTTWQIVYTNGANEGMAYVQTGITTSDVKPEDNFSFIDGKYVQISFDFEKLVPAAA